MIKGIAEILKEAGNTSSINEKIKILQSNSSPGLKAVLGYTYDPRVRWMLPKEDPPFKRNPKELDLQGVLHSEYRRFYLFVDCPDSKDIRQVKREQAYIGLLEMVDPDDADLLLAMKRRHIPYNGITYKLVKKAFPNMTKDWPAEPPREYP